jgi:hypothetical protein
MICSPISSLLRGGMVRVGATRGQVLHLFLPHHRQRAGDGCLAERLLPRFRAWTCCSDNNFKFQVQGGKFQVGHNFKLELMNSGPSMAHIQSCSPSWPISSCRLAALSSELGHRQSPRSALESAQHWASRLGFTAYESAQPDS